MSSPDTKQDNALPAERLIGALPELLVSLRRHGFEIGTEQYLSACDLILSLTLDDELIPPRVLRPGLGGLFSERREQQEAFAGLFDPWYRGLGLEPLEASSVKPAPELVAPTWNDRLRHMLRRYRWYAMAIALSLALALAWWLYEPVVDKNGNKATIGDGAVTTEQPDFKSLPNFIPPPKTPAEPVIPPARDWPAWADWARLLWIVPFSLWCFWFLSRVFLRQVVLKKRKQRPGETTSLRHLELATDQANLFSSPELAETWRQLRRYRAQPTRRLDEPASVMRTLERGGYFSPVFRQRQVPPAYIALNDRRHAQDHVAGMMQELVAAMGRENLQVTLFDYHADPDYAVKVGELGGERNPAELAAVYSDHDLLMAGDGDALFETGARGERHKLDAFAPFHRRVLLTPNPLRDQQQRSDAYEEADFQRYPLSPQGLAQLGQAGDKTGWDSLYDLAMPRLLTVDPNAWLEERPVAKEQLRSLLQQLEEYLGEQGMELLCATAAYPELNWALTRALDLQLGLSPRERPLRLRKLSRLPWFRYGRIPDYLRRALLRHIDGSAFRRLNRAFRALLEKAHDKPLRLPYAVPEWRGVWAYWKDQILLSPPHHPLADRVFASVVRGRQPGMLEFVLPHWHQVVLGAGWRGLVMPLVSGLVLLPLAVWLNLWTWQAWLEPKARLTALAAMQKIHGETLVTISATGSLGRHGEALHNALINWGFQVRSELAQLLSDVEKTNRVSNRVQIGSQPADLPESVTAARNQIHYQPQDRAIAGFIAQRLSYLYYGEEAELIERNQAQTTADTGVSVVLAAAPRVFRDALKSGDEFFMETETATDSVSFGLEQP